MSQQDGLIDTDREDLSGILIRDLLARDDDHLMAAVDQVRCEVPRPRTNLGSSGPPGRVD